MNLLEVSKEDKEFVRTDLQLKEEDVKRDVEILKDWIKKEPHLPQGVQDLKNREDNKKVKGVTDEDKAFVRKQLGLKEGDIKKDVKILKEWLKQQPHLPQGVQDDVFFERFVIGNNGLEESEHCIDNYYSVKTFYPELFTDLHKLRPSGLPLDLVPNTKLGNVKEILIFVKYYTNTGDTFDLLEVVKLFFAELEILNSKLDCCSGLRILVDLTDFKYDMLKLLKPHLMQKLLTFIHSVYSYKLLGIHYLKPPTWIEELMDMFRTIVKNDIIETMTFHDDVKSLTEKIPLEFLPKDYGGNQPSLNELKEKWDQILEDNKELLEEVPKLKSEEKLRKGRFDTEMFGVGGTF